ncbi:Ldh family oxidoreductase [Bacillus sp. FJAT-44742]|uniref:Ldh family oxidoreductase n=1 Tax=Bacillus sp. FJAT-44742 TaxID=2014005 RepID=UPI000C24FD8F|nr:Ldh family oxidoreductase [Bacillus sp. FJAT-44742]
MDYFKPSELENFTSQVLTEVGVEQDKAKIVAEALIKADLEGLGSHGISRLSTYIARITDNRINNKPDIKISELSPTALLVDGDNGLGHLVAYEGLQEGIKLAKKQGIAAVAINNSNHNGTSAYYCQLACEENMMLMAGTNSPPGIAPWGGKDAFFGTNPIAFGFPYAKGQSPVIVDMSTSTVARGKIILADKQGEKIPDGWALDSEGNMTNDPKEALNGGTVLPLGGAKGAALALTIEILTGVMTGAAISPHVKNIYDTNLTGGANVGHFFLLMDMTPFENGVGFQNKLDTLITLMKEVDLISENSPIRYPGERRQQEAALRSKEGIPLSKTIQTELEQLGEKVGVSFKAYQY